MAEFKSEKKGSNIICRVSNATPEMVCRYVQRLPKHKMTEKNFRKYMGLKWFQNEHQAPEQWGLYYVDGEYYYPRFEKDITLDEAERYLYGWMKRLIVINPYTRFKVTNDSRLVEAIVKQLEDNPNEHDLKTIIRNIIDSDEPFIVNDIIANALNNYSEVLKVQVIDKDTERFSVSLLPNYKEILKTKYNMTKKEYFDSFSDINTSAPLNEPRQVIYFGAPGTGKSHKIKQLIKDNKINESTNVFRTTFHPDSDYSTFVGCYKPIKEERTRTEIINGKVSVVKNPDGTDAKESNITYTFIPQAFLKAYIKAYNSPEESVILVIEEINRGNCAQIFGDLFQLLDRKEDGTSEYPIKADDDVRRFLEEGKDEEGNDILVKKEGIANGELSLPSNLYIWATMNTSDQSLFPIDSAFKRRWEWKYIPIANAQKNYVIDVDGNQYDWWSFLDTINILIEDATHSEDKKLGYFFAKTDNNIISVNTFVSKVIFYLWNDVFKDYESNHEAFTDENGNMLTFHKFFRPDGEVDTNVVITFLKKLGVDSFEVENPDEQGAIEVQPNNQRKKDHSRYSVNGFTNLNKALLTRKVLELYIKDHPSDDTATIVSSWSKLGLEKAVQHLLETEDMYNERTKVSKDPNKRCVPFDLGNGETVYLSTQFGIGNIDRFIEAINNANWNIRISKMTDQA